MISLQKVLAQIRQAEHDYQRPPGSVRLLAVTKGRDIQAILAAAAAGQTAFGENYVQEALTKIRALASYSLEWHFIGALQANKTRAVAENFSWVHSITRFKIAERLHQQCLGETWHANQQCVATRKNGDKRALDHLLLAEDDCGGSLPDPLNALARRFDAGDDAVVGLCECGHDLQTIRLRCPDEKLCWQSWSQYEQLGTGCKACNGPKYWA